MEIWIIGGKRSRTHLRWTYIGNGLELLTPIALNKNGWLSYKKLDTMIGAISPQFPKYDVHYQDDNLHIDKTYPTFRDRKKNLSTN
jgi:hypothetical protein